MLYLIYSLLLFGFLLICAFIFRHMLKFGYLAPKFRWLVMLMGGMALGIILFSLSLLIQLDRAPSATFDLKSETKTSNSDDLDF